MTKAPTVLSTALPDHLEFRVSLLERSLADAQARIGELTQALAGVAKIDASGVDESPPTPILIDADAVAPFAAGFYRREEDAEGRSFRWTGRTDFFEFRVAIDRNLEWTYTMEIRPNLHLDGSMLRAYVDYAEMPFRVEEMGRHICGSIPRRPFSTLGTLTFYLPSRFVPSVVDPKVKDSRTLGVAFYGLRLEPASPVSDQLISEERLVAVDASL